MTDALESLVCALADDELIIGHRHSEWTGYAPHIEADVAFSSIAQDEIGHAAQLYRLISGGESAGADDLALGRPATEYRNAVLCERANRDWAYTLARHWIYDTADALRLEALESTSEARLASLVTKIRREERYHLIHAETWIKRLARGPVEGRTKLAHALGDTFAEAAGLFEPFELEDEAVAAGLWPVPSEELGKRFFAQASAALDELGLPTEIRGDGGGAEFVASSSGDLIASDEENGAAPVARQGGLGGRRGRHSEELEPLWEVMTSTFRAEPEATW